MLFKFAFSVLLPVRGGSIFLFLGVPYFIAHHLCAFLMCATGLEKKKVAAKHDDDKKSGPAI